MTSEAQGDMLEDPTTEETTAQCQADDAALAETLRQYYSGVLGALDEPTSEHPSVPVSDEWGKNRQ